MISSRLSRSGGAGMCTGGPLALGRQGGLDLGPGNEQLGLLGALHSVRPLATLFREFDGGMEQPRDAVELVTDRVGVLAGQRLEVAVPVDLAVRQDAELVAVPQLGQGFQVGLDVLRVPGVRHGWHSAEFPIMTPTGTLDGGCRSWPLCPVRKSCHFWG